MLHVHPLPLSAQPTHACEKCGLAVAAVGQPDRIETVTACDKGGTCVYVRRDTGS